MMFSDDIVGSGGSDRKEVSRAEVEEILKEAKNKFLVTRSFRNEENMTQTDGICFCCDDCCDYFLNPSENVCDKGKLIEETNSDKCIGCGTCVEVCYFGARKLDDELIINQDNCYSCGLCVDVCPEDCINMVDRN